MITLNVFMYITLVRVSFILSILGNCLSKTNISQNYNEEFVPRVVNGRPAKLGDVPYQVAFKGLVTRMSLVYMTFCGGTIIAPTKILSAAHCFVEDKSACLRIFSNSGVIRQRQLIHKYAVAGTLYNKGRKPSSDFTEEGQWRMLSSVHYPRGYRFPKQDIAIVFTTTPFQYNSFVNYIPYARRHADYSGSCLVSGYGRITSTGTATSNILLLAHLVIVPTRPCSIHHRKNMRHFVCTSSRVTDVGKGDSGGPFVCKGTQEQYEASNGILVGIVSGHRYGIGSFFTRVSSYQTFIQNNKSSFNQQNILLFYVFLTIIIEQFFAF